MYVCMEQKLEIGRLKAERDAVVGYSFRPTIHSEPGARSRSRSTGRSRIASESNVFVEQYGEDEYEYNHDNSFNEPTKDAASLSSSRPFQLRILSDRETGTEAIVLREIWNSIVSSILKMKKMADLIRRIRVLHLTIPEKDRDRNHLSSSISFRNGAVYRS
jgi:hypothetical protein